MKISRVDKLKINNRYYIDLGRGKLDVILVDIDEDVLFFVLETNYSAYLNGTIKSSDFLIDYIGNKFEDPNVKIFTNDKRRRSKTVEKKSKSKISKRRSKTVEKKRKSKISKRRSKTVEKKSKSKISKRKKQPTKRNSKISKTVKSKRKS